MRTLTKYVLSRVAGRFVLLLGLFIAVIVGGQVTALIARGVPPEVLGPTLVAMILIALPVALPMAVATAVLVALSAMNRDGELQALAAAGIDPAKTALRLWPFVAMIAVATLLLWHLVMPLGLGTMRSLMANLLQATIAQRVVNLEPIWDRDGITAWASHVEGRELQDVRVRRIVGDEDLAVYAPRATWGLTGKGIEFSFSDVRMISRTRDGRLITGEAAHWACPEPSDTVQSTEPDTMSTPRLLEELRTAPRTGPDQSRYNNARLTLHLRLWMPVATAIFALFAAGLAMVLAGAESLVAVGLVIFTVTLGIYPAVGYVKADPDRHMHDPGFLLWIPGVILATLGWWMLHRPQSVRDVLAAPVSALARWWKRQRGRPSTGESP